MEVKISAAIITFNEEKNIERCLNSLKGIADEILVVDSFSTDRTEEICLNQGVRFVKNKFEGHVEQKNVALSLATHHYVLSLDADEALSDELKESISLVKKNWSFDGYEMNRLTNYCGKWIRHCGWYPDTKLRLVKKDCATWGGTNPHDQLQLITESKTGLLKGDLLHYSFYSVEEHKRQIEYFTDVSSKALFKKGKKTNWLKILFSPFAQFIKGYLLNLGFLDGKYGWIICWLSAKSKYMRYRKLMRLTRGMEKEVMQ